MRNITTGNKIALPGLILSGTFILYVMVAGVTAYHHELWGDEIHSWNIAKGSESFFDLVGNTRYEGHPPLWYVLLWTISKFTHNLFYVQLIHLLIASATVFIILFYSPFPFFTKLLMPFGYFFIYEYSVLSRNYAIGVLLAFCICLLMYKEFKYKLHLYYFLLFLLANTHLIALLLAISLHIYFLILKFGKKKKRTALSFHVIAGGFIFLSSAYFILPPSDSAMNASFWAKLWDASQLRAIGQLPFRSFVPVPAWWHEYFWNTEFLLDGKERYPFLKFINPLLLIAIIFVAFVVLKKDKKSLILFAANLLLSCIITMTVFRLTTGRYSGFIFIGFLAAYWLYSYQFKTVYVNRLLVNSLLVIQIIAGVFMVSKDLQLPFSHANKVNELLKQVPSNEKAVTDYWALNTIAAFTNKTFFCVDMEKEMSFILWNTELANMQRKPNRYTAGINNYLKNENRRQLYLISTHSIESIFKVDPTLAASFQVLLIDKREGAFEKGSNLYLYKISR